MWQSQLNVQIVEIRDQYIHCIIEDPRIQRFVYFTVVFAMNDIQLKNRLWSELGQLDRQLKYPWLLCGYFNSVLSSGIELAQLLLQVRL